MVAPAEASVFQTNCLSHKERGFSLALRCGQLDQNFKERLSLNESFRKLQNKIPIIESPEYHLGNSFVVPTPESIEIKTKSAKYIITVDGNSIVISRFDHRHLDKRKIVSLTLLRAKEESNQIRYQERRIIGYGGKGKPLTEITLDCMNSYFALSRGEELFNSFVENSRAQI